MRKRKKKFKSDEKKPLWNSTAKNLSAKFNVFFFFFYIQLILQNAVALKRKGGFVKNKKLNHKTSAYESRKSH